MPLTIPSNLAMPLEAHKNWLQVVQETKSLIERDEDLQKKAAQGLRLRERQVPPEVLGALYAKYCSLVNRMYQSYLDSEHLQRAPYIKDLVEVMLRRLFELRNELVFLIVNDYIYVDTALIQQRLTPQDIEIIVPCHYAMEARKNSIEELLQAMWTESIQRVTAPTMVHKSTSALYNRRLSSEEEEVSAEVIVENEPSIVTEEYIRASVIQKHERFRQYYMRDFKTKCIRRRTYFAQNIEPAPEHMRIAAAIIIQKLYRRFMEIKRQRVEDHKRNVLLGIVPDPWPEGRLNLKEETKKLYKMRRRINERTRQVYMEELEKENTRLILLKRDVQIDDITEHIREWFKEWFYGYGFFPEYPYDTEGGTIMVIRGTYPTIAEKFEEDEKLAAATKGKTKEMLKAEKKQAKLDAINRAKTQKEEERKIAEQEYKMKCNPLNDLGYKIAQSSNMGGLHAVLQRYCGSWSVYDSFPPEHFSEVIYGYIRPILTEELMGQLHQDCRRYVDELMRLEMKLLVEAHKAYYRTMGQKFPVIKPRKKPPPVRVPKPSLDVDGDALDGFKYLFDLGIISKPSSKIDDIIGDSNYAAYECNIADPDARFPPPGYGDVRTRLALSCVFAAGLVPAAARNSAVLLLGPPRNGKSFLVDCVAGEMNAVKIDISPEMFSSVVASPAQALADVFLAARVFQPCVVYMRDVERVFIKPAKVPPDQIHLKAGSVKNALIKCVKRIAPEDKIIFIATCTTPFGFPAESMVSMFNEIVLVPRADYNSLQLFFYYKLQSIRSMERDYCVQVLAQVLQGYGFGAIMKMFDRVMCAERIVRLNVTPFSPIEFIADMAGEEQFTLEDYKMYEDFFIANSPLKKPRAELLDINIRRADVYQKLAKKNDEKAKEN